MQFSQRFIADQRWDLPHYKNMIGFIEDSFQEYYRSFITSSNHVVRNWQIEGTGGLGIRVNPSVESTLFSAERTGFEDFIIRKTTEDILTLNLSDNAVNYVEVQIFEETCANDTVAIWDATANSGAGQEFTQNVDTVRHQEQRLVSNTTAFTGDNDKIPLAIVTTSGGAIIDITDVRDLLFHLESDFSFGSPRTDKGIYSIKQMYDAITTIIKEVKQSPTWYSNDYIGTVDLLERLNYMLVDGGTIGWDITPGTLQWSGALRIIAPSRSYNYTISAQSVASVADGEVLYVTLPDEGVVPSGPLTVNKVDSSAYVIDSANTRNFIIAYRSGSKIYFGNGWQSVELESGEQNQLGDGITQAWIAATGLTDENDSTPPYTSTLVITPSGSFTLAISELDATVDSLLGLVSGPVYQQSIIVPPSGYTAGTQLTLPSGESYQIGYNQLEVYFNGVLAQSGAGEDYLEVNDGGGAGNKIQLVYDLPAGMRITYRIQIGGSGFGAGTLDIFDEGVATSLGVKKIDFIGSDITATEVAPGEVEVTVSYSAPLSLVKRYYNQTGSVIPINKAVAFDDLGNIVLADANIVAISDFCGITAEAIADSSFGSVVKLGNVANAASGLGLTAGDYVYLGETPGELQGTPPVGITDTIIVLGRAEPPHNASGTADDLYLNPQVIADGN